MYRKEKRIPTILAILFILAGIGGALYLDGTYQSLTTKATSSPAPSEIHLTNITDNSITVSYVTNEQSLGAVKVDGANNKNTVIDDLDQNAGVKPRITHTFTIKNLLADNVYKLTVVSGNNNCKNNKCPEFLQRTGIKLDKILDLPPVSGQIVDRNNNPVEGAIIYLIIGKAAPLSARSDKIGMFAVPLNNLRTQDLLRRPEIAGDESIQITIKSKPSEYASVLTSLNLIKSNPKLSKIELGKTYNYLTTNKNTTDSQPTVLGNNTSYILTPTPTFAVSKSGIDILFPEHKMDTTIDKQPKLRGIGIPGDKIKITIQSTPQTATVIVNADGTWEYRPKRILEPGSHTITIRGKDNTGKTVTVREQFVVLKSGESVLGDSTPSASLTPTNTPSVTPTIDPNITLTITPTGSATISATPTQTPTPTLTPTPTPTDTPTPTPTPAIVEPTQTPPRAGNSNWTKILIGGGVTLMFLGLKLLF